LRRIAAPAILISLALPGAVAHAAVPVVLDASPAATSPAVAVGQDGTAYLAWNQRRAPGQSDVTHYCRIPRGARACTSRRALVAPPEAGQGGLDSAGPQVLVPDADTVVVLAQRCCRARLEAWTSTDGGVSFGAPREIGSNAPSGGAALGPGGFAASTITSGEAGGTFFQAAPLQSGTEVATPPASDRADVGDLGGGASASEGGSVAFLDPLTPIAAFGDGSRVYSRRFGGGLDFNSLAGWDPPTVVDRGSAPRLASGPKGVFLLYRTPGAAPRLVVRRWDGTSFAGAPVDVADGSGASDFFADAGGRLHVVFTSGAPPATTLSQRVSDDGVVWQDQTVLATPVGATAVSELHAGAASDGGGFAVWDVPGSGVSAVRFGPDGPLSPDCVPSVRVGGTVARALDGCWVRSGSAYRTPGGLTLNGIRLSRRGSRFTLVPSRRSLVSDRPVRVSFGGLVLSAGQRIAWRLPASGSGSLRELAGGQASLAAPSVSGLALRAVYPSLAPGGGATVRVPASRLGLARLRPFALRLGAAPMSLTAVTQLLVPGSRAVLPVALTIANGGLAAVVADASFSSPLALPAGVRLSSESWRLATVDVCGRQTLAGPASLALGAARRSVAPILTLDGAASLRLSGASCLAPSALSSDGTGRLRDLPAGPLSLRTTSVGGATFSGALAGPPELAGQVDVAGEFGGGLDPATGAWYATGAAAGSLPGLGVLGGTGGAGGSASVVMSGDGARVCGTVASADPAVPVLAGGYHYRWGQPPLVDYPGCAGDTASFVAAGPGDDGLAFTVPAKAASVTVRIDGSLGAPDALLVDPGGQTLASAVAPAAGVTGAGFASVRVDPQARTYFLLTRPRAGRWLVRSQPGSRSQVIAAASAVAIAAPALSGTVRIHGGRRELTYRLAARPGQTVTAFERGGGVSRSLGRLASGAHTLTFVPARGTTTRHDVIAIVESGGIPRTRIVIARYSAPIVARGS
jgi:hypothetical protein